MRCGEGFGRYLGGLYGVMKIEFRKGTGAGTQLMQVDFVGDDWVGIKSGISYTCGLVG